MDHELDCPSQNQSAAADDRSHAPCCRHGSVPWRGARGVPRGLWERCARPRRRWLRSHTIQGGFVANPAAAFAHWSVRPAALPSPWRAP